MPKDPIVEEVRRVRARLARAHGNDLVKIVRALRESEAKSGRRSVTLPPRKTRKRRAG